METLWVQFPGIVGTDTGARWFKPGYDVQAGKVFEDRSQQQAWLRRTGKVEMGPEEYKRSVNNAHSPEPSFAGLKDAMKEAWEETVVGGKVYKPAILDKQPDITIDSSKGKE